MSDFDLMLMRKKEEKSGRRRKKDIDIINDNDDIIAQLISDMKHAAQVKLKCFLSNFLEKTFFFQWKSVFYGLF